MDDAHRAAAAIRETGGLAGYTKTDAYSYRTTENGELMATSECTLKGL